jgi:hypothetical protein
LNRPLTEDEGEKLVGEFVNRLDAFAELTDARFEATLGISRAEYESLYARCEDVLTDRGRGNRTAITGRGVLVMLIFTLRTGWRQKRIAVELGVGRSTVTRMLQCTGSNRYWLIAEQREHCLDKRFVNYPDAVGALDVTELALQKPHANQAEHQNASHRFRQPRSCDKRNGGGAARKSASTKSCSTQVITAHDTRSAHPLFFQLEDRRAEF